MKNINFITNQSFSKYGSIIDFSENPENELFEIVIKEEQLPWRIAMLKVNWHVANRLERHPHSYETFEPISGVGIILVAEYEHPEDWKAFLLDKPICLKKGIWHEVIALSNEAKYKLTENAEVECEYLQLNKPVSVAIND